jgi:putative transposase
VPLGGSLFRGAALEVPDDSLQAWPAASIAAFNGHGFLVRKPQYTSAEFDAFTTRQGIRRSLGRTGVCWDNAAAESLFAALKNEMYYRQSFATRARARFAVAEYIEVFYNRKRLHSSLGYRTPFEALTDYRTAATVAA